MKKFLGLLVFALIVWGCSSDDDGPELLQVQSNTFTNLYAPQTGGQGQGPIEGEFTRFDFASGNTTTSSTDWDIAFRGTSIIINGGVSLGTTDEPERTGTGAAYIATGTFADIASVTRSEFVQDSASGYAIPSGSGNGWYSYNPMANTIEPIPGRILVIRTRDNRYAKVEILSYYKDAPETITAEIATNDLRYYTFSYAYQPNEGSDNF
ncbi:MAG: HmuY family protein [Bacteroidia bacterium]|nr:HmuY family protein [Bacteroidia bacterium]